MGWVAAHQESPPTVHRQLNKQAAARMVEKRQVRADLCRAVTSRESFRAAVLAPMIYQAIDADTLSA